MRAASPFGFGRPTLASREPDRACPPWGSHWRLPARLLLAAALLLSMDAARALGADAGNGGTDASAAAAGGAPGRGGGDPVVAEVDGRPIHLAEIGDAIRALPDAGGRNSFQSLYPIVLRRLIEREALVNRAQAEGVADDPVVQRHMREAADRVLENEYLQRAAARLVTEQSLLARYDSEIRGKPGPEQVHGRAILVANEAEAEDAIAKLASGADFATLARAVSKDSTAAAGGDLGFVGRNGLATELSTVLFALRPGEVTPYPVRAAAGWFVLKAEERRRGPTPSFAEVRDRLEAESLQANVLPVLRETLGRAAIRAYDMNGRQVTPDLPDEAAESGSGAAR